MNYFFWLFFAALVINLILCAYLSAVYAPLEMSSGEVSSLEMSSGKYVDPDDDVAKGLSSLVIIMAFAAFLSYLIIVGKTLRGYNGLFLVNKVFKFILLGLLITAFVAMVPSLYLSDCLINAECNEAFKTVNLSASVITGIVLPAMLIVPFVVMRR